ncbi:response regulator [Streptomyces sp. NPDC052040]|uniref:response regulator n=1 Tax=Streptomyces sp. NPDC052040 TaxID=3365682 RepID=UPI0037D1A686
MTTPAISVLVADDDAMVRTHLRTIVGTAPDIEIVGEASDGETAVTRIRECLPDVVLLDIFMPGKDGLAVARDLAKLPTPPEVVILTTFALDAHVEEAVRAGASGFLRKDTPPRDLLQAIRVVAAGEAVLSPSVTRRILDFVQDGENAITLVERERLLTLTRREREVLALVGQGLTNTEIAGQLHMSPSTVKLHVSRLLGKLDVTNRVQAALLAYRARATGAEPVEEA